MGRRQRLRLVSFALAIGVPSLVGVVASLWSGAAKADRFDSSNGISLELHRSKGGWPNVRGDDSRRGVTRSAIPDRGLRIGVRHSPSSRLELPPLVDESGTIAFVTRRGEVVRLGKDGSERSKLVLGSGTVGAATLAPDGSFIVTIDRDVLSFRGGALRFRTNLGEFTGPARIAPLALEDSSLIVVAGSALVYVGTDGAIRGRALLRLAPRVPLVATPEGAIAIDEEGVVHRWAPGRDLERVGSFDAPVDGVAAYDGEGGLVATTRGTRLARLDLATRSLETLLSAGNALFVSAPVIARGTVAVLATLPSGRTELLRVPLRRTQDRSEAGPADLQRITVETPNAQTAGLALDGGASALAALTLRGTLMGDTSGRFAFSAPGGTVGTVASDGSVTTLGEPACGAASSAVLRSGLGLSGPVSGGDGRLVLGCETGGVVILEGAAP